jgi:pimeloyl-ACP methyl ester carboxylesterase
VQTSVPPVQAAPAVAAVSQAVVAAVPVAKPTAPPAVEAPQTSGAVQPAAEAPKTSQAVSKDLPEDQVFVKPNPSGLIEVSGYKYPVYLFVPKDYKTDRTYAMIMLAPAESAKAEKQIEYLTGLAQRRSIFILAPYVLWPKAGDTPYTLDQWLLTVKKDVIERYPINSKRVYLIGKDSGAHYAAYMGVKYPREFAAVALLGEAWDGQFAQLVDPRSDAADQVPFFIALKAGGNAKARNQAWFDKLQKKGYPLHLVDYQTEQDLAELDFKKTVFDWLETTSQSWSVTRAQSQKNWKGKFKKGVKDFFEV